MPKSSKTRSSSPIAPFLDEDSPNMTSGDESDNEDLTDASSDSEWFEFASGYSRHLWHASRLTFRDIGSSDRGIHNSLLMRYSHVTRHYIAYHLETLGLWDRHPFVLTKVWRFLSNTECIIKVSCIAGSYAPVLPGQ